AGNAYPNRPAAEDRLTIEPPPAALSIGTAKCAQRNCPVRQTSMVRRQSSGLISSTPPVGPAIPALLISASSPPSEALTSSNKRATSASEDTSARVTPAFG